MLELKDRTFGFELEFADVVKSDVKLPEGYKWSPDETTMFNTTGKTAPVTGNIGGEINTRPLLPCRKDVRELRRVVMDCIKHNGKSLWNSGFDGHLYVGDLGLDELKKIFALGFYVSPLIKEVFNLGEWFDVPYLVPIPTIEMYNKVMSARDLSSFRECFSNSSNRGYIRYAVNVMAFFHHETIEFRIFNGTENFRHILETIKFMYNFVDFAIKNDETDFKKIKTVESFLNAFNISGKFSKGYQPMIFAEDVSVNTRSIAHAFEPSNKIISSVNRQMPDDVAILNPFLFTLETSLTGNRNIRIYNNNPLPWVFYKISQGMWIEYKDRFSILNEYKNGTLVREISLFIIFRKLRKFSFSNDYGIKEFLAYTSKIEESLEKLAKTAQKIFDFCSKVTWINGNLLDALNAGEKNILFQQEHLPKFSQDVYCLSKFSDYVDDFKYREMSYYNLEEKLNGLDYFQFISKNEFMPFYKVAQDKKQILYSNKNEYAGLENKKENDLKVIYKIPDDDYRITEKSQIRIEEVSPSVFKELQKTFVKKVMKFMFSNYAFVVMDGDILLGGMGFLWVVDKENKYDLFLISDFSTNNKVPLLSKLILYMVTSTELKNRLEEKRCVRVLKGYTHVYTNKPVSMKYRGIFNKVGRVKENLMYDFDFGSSGTIKQGVQKYLEKVKKRNAE